MSNKSSRDIILSKVKSALTEKNQHQMPDLTSGIFSSTEEKDLALIFASNFISIKGEFIFCENAKELQDNLINVINQKGLKNIFAWEPEIISILKGSQVNLSTNEDNFVAADAGITGCEALIARTGSILVSSGTKSGRRLGIFPHVHIVIANVSQLVEDIKDGFSVLRKKYKNNLPSMISLETGPSRTADIEKTLVLGAHGPKELILFLIDDTH